MMEPQRSHEASARRSDPAALRKEIIKRWESLKTERSSWMDHWETISDYVLPRSGRFFVTDRNRGSKDRWNKIYDSTATRALRVLAAGMMSGMTSPARPWFRLTTSDPDLDESATVKDWLDDVTRLMQMVFAKSNTYRALHTAYEELGAFGTTASILYEDFDDIIHLYPCTVGEFAIAADFRGIVNTVYREFEMPVGAVVKEFGYEKCSDTVRTAFDAGKLDDWVDIIHAIEPRPDSLRKPEGRTNKDMPYRSVFIEAANTKSGVLRESGFKEFPALCPRWSTIGGDIYGSSPAMEALGDIKQLQHEQMRKANAIDFQVRPPLQGPASMRGMEPNLLPGGFTPADMAAPHAAIQPLFNAQANLQHLLTSIADDRQRIQQAFYSDLFLMFANDSVSNMTATEVAQRQEEKLLMIGPVLERLHNEILDPLISLTFSKMMAAGIVPQPPEDLNGKELNVELVSMLAQAQRAVTTNSSDRLVACIGTLAQLKPEAVDKLDADALIDYYSDALGVDPSIIVPGDQVALVRQQRAQQQQAAQEQAQQAQNIQNAKTLSDTDTAGQNGLTDVMSQFSGY